MEKPAPVVSDSQTPPWYKKRNVIIDAAVIVAVLLIIAIVWWVGHRPKPVTTTTDVPQYTDQQLITEVNKKYGLNDYLGAVKLIKGQKRVNEPANQSLLAAAYANAGDNARALEVYRQLDRQNKLSEVDTSSAAEIANRAKDYRQAIDWYEKAKQRANPQDTDQIAVYQYQIEELQKKL